tara:strand:+ start:4130 stop:4375 length:246 start_codon:yes stop_codon:yes gene_type:complete
MKNFLDKEYHPVIEDYITNYVDDNLDMVERDAFEEVLVYEDELRELAFSAKEGLKLLQSLHTLKAADGFQERLNKRLAEKN